MLVTILGGSLPGGWGGTAWTLAASAFRGIPIRVPVQLSQSPSIWLDRAELSIRQPRVLQRAAHSQDAALEQLPIGSIVSAERLILKKPRIRFNVAQKSEVKSEGFEAAALSHVLQPLFGLSFDKLVLKHGTVLLESPTGRATTLDDFGTEIAASSGHALSSARGSFSYGGEKLTFDATFGTSIEKASVRSLPVRLSVSGAQLEAAFDGTVVLGSSIHAAGKLELTTPNLRALTHWLGHDLFADRGLGAARIKGDVTWRDGVLAFDNASLTLDGNTGTGALSLNLSMARPSLDGTLAFKSLDLALYTVRVAKASPPARFPAWHDGTVELVGEPSVPATIDLTAPWLGRLDADVRISANKISGLGVETGKGAASIALRQGKLIADIAELEIQGGSASGQISIDTAGLYPAYATRVKLENVALGAIVGPVLSGMLMPAASKPPKGMLEGSGTLVVDVSARGRKLEELIQSMNGDARLVMTEGGRVQVNIGELTKEARTRKAFQWTSEAPGETGFQKLTADIAIRNGSLISESLQLRTNALAVTGDGRINLNARQVYMRLQIDTAAAAGTVHSFAGASPARGVGVLLIGPWARPTIRLDDAVAGEPILLRPISISGSAKTAEPAWLVPALP